jgi:hypothetical protein
MHSVQICLFPLLYLLFLNQVIIVASLRLVILLNSTNFSLLGNELISYSATKKLKFCFDIQRRVLLEHFDFIIRPN